MSTGEQDRNWTRRGVLAAGCAAVGAAAMQGAARAAGQPSDKDDPYGPFKMGLQSYSLRGLTRDGKADLQKSLDATKDLGVHFWESYPDHVPMTTDSQQVAAIKQQLETAGVTLIGYGVVHLGADEAANRKYFEFARAMGLKYLSASPEPGTFDKLDKLVEEYGVAIGIHNHGPGDRYEKIETIEKAIKDHHPKIGCCVDTGHFLRSREDPVHAVEVFGQRVYGVHLKDVKDARTFTVLGRGDLRTVDLLKALAQNHYDYCLAIEYEENPANPFDEIKDCLAEARRAIAAAKKA
jgi:inosose dehydratase